ncbi:hypothetical protein ABPG74_010324 [Tetrahymena malaccensis]
MGDEGSDYSQEPEDFGDELIEDDFDDVEFNEEEDIAILQANEDQDLSNKKYCRPAIDTTKINEQNDFYFMQLDADYFLVSNNKKEGDNGDDKQKQAQENSKKEDENSEREPIIRMYGVTKDQHSVLVSIRGVVPYLFVKLPQGIQPNAQTLKSITDDLNKLGKFQRNVKTTNFIRKIEVVKGESIKYYKGKGYPQDTFLKIYTFIPPFIPALRGIIEKGYTIDGVRFPAVTFESNIPFALRYMIDADIVGMGWIKLDKDKFKIRSADKHKSRCQIEIDVDYQHVHGMDAQDPQWADIAPLRIFSFDIECLALTGGFPSAQKDPIIQIATVLKIHDQQEDIVRTVFTMDTCANIPGCIVKSFKTETELLQEWEKFLQNVDPDIFLGYNITNFDFPYILERGKQLKINNGKYGFMGRIRNTVTRIKDGKYLSKAMGMRDTKEMNFEGRIQLDMLMHMHRETKLSSYSLNNVSYHFLNEQKEDVHHTQISGLQKGDAETRKRLAVYCLKDAQLPLKLMQKLMCIYNYTEMARVTGVPINFLFTRGQQIKVASQLYRRTKLLNLYIPTERSQGQGDKYEGAFVLQPKKGFYDKPIATLDFASLYPSIMMAHNLCYSTLISKNVAMGMNKDDYTLTPHGDYFAKPHVRQGILPDILKELLAARKKAKNELAKETDPLRKAVLDGRQLALKISANSVYGFTGAQVGQLPCLEISSSVTSFGRQMIEATRDFVLIHYNKQNGYNYDSDVIYGDTDSVMVKFGCDTIEEAMKYGKEAADLISKKLFINPIKLEFEKVYYPYLLISKKRYAGCFYTRPDKYDKIDTKGMENVRRDNCQFIREMMNTCLKYILVEHKQDGIQRSIQFIKGCISDLYQNKVDISKLVITKSLTKKSADDDEGEEDGKNKGSGNNNKGKQEPAANQYKGKQAHVELAKKMAKRDPGSAPCIGDRIPYVIVAGTKAAKNYEKVEDPIYVLENDIPLDYEYYIEKQIKNPITRIYCHIIDNVDSLFTGEHTKNRYQPKVNSGLGLGKFIVKKENCLHCKCQVNGKQPICDNCLERNPQRLIDIYTEKIIQHQSIEYQYNQLWTQCQRCQGSLHEKVICSNRDCPIYYKRTKLQTDLSRSQQLLSRFDDW